MAEEIPFPPDDPTADEPDEPEPSDIPFPPETPPEKVAFPYSPLPRFRPTLLDFP